MVTVGGMVSVDTKPFDGRRLTMTVPRKTDNADTFGSRAFFMPLLWIAALVGVYCVLADWHAVPALIAATVAAMH